MFQYREVLVRLRQGDTDREIPCSGPMGRRKVAVFRYRCEYQGWLHPAMALPGEAELAALGPAKRACSTISSVEPYRAVVQRWVAQGVNTMAIHAALSREHGYRGSYSSVYRMLIAISAMRTPEATVPLYFPPAEAAQVDFGAGPLMHDPAVLRTRRRHNAYCLVLDGNSFRAPRLGPTLRTKVANGIKSTQA